MIMVQSIFILIFTQKTRLINNWRLNNFNEWIFRILIDINIYRLKFMDKNHRVFIQNLVFFFVFLQSDESDRMLKLSSSSSSTSTKSPIDQYDSDYSEYSNDDDDDEDNYDDDDDDEADKDDYSKDEIGDELNDQPKEGKSRDKRDVELAPPVRVHGAAVLGRTSDGVPVVSHSYQQVKQLNRSGIHLRLYDNLAAAGPLPVTEDPIRPYHRVSSSWSPPKKHCKYQLIKQKSPHIKSISIFTDFTLIIIEEILCNEVKPKSNTRKWIEWKLYNITQSISENRNILNLNPKWIR